jgi:hypothetical protein
MNRLKGDLSFSQEVHGESFYQEALAKAAAQRKGRKAYQVIAVLIPEPKNPKDAHAVRVEVNGLKVGYLPKGMGAAFKASLRQYKLGDVVECLAQIRGGFQGSDDFVYYGIWLDLPEQLIGDIPVQTAPVKKGCGCPIFGAIALSVLIGLLWILIG